MRLIPQVAASVGVESQQLEAAMLLALDASTERTYGWSMGLRLKLGHLCRHVFLVLLVSQHRCAMSQDVSHVAHHSFAEPSAAEHVLYTYILRSIYSNAGTLHHHYGLEYVRVILLSHPIYIVSSISKASLMTAYRSKVLFFAIHVWWCTPPLALHRV